MAYTDAMAKNKRFHMRTTDEWREIMALLAEYLGVSRSEAVEMAGIFAYTYSELLRAWWNEFKKTE